MTTSRAASATLRTLALGAAAGSIMLALPACGGKTVKVESGDSTTMGQELQDLDKSYREGIITEKEYQRAKKEILEGKR